MFCVFLSAVEHMQKEWGCLAKSIRSEPQAHQLPACAARYCSCFLFIQYSACIILICFVFAFKLIFYTALVPLLFAFSSSGPAVQRAMEKVQKAINRHVLNISIAHTKYIYKPCVQI